MTFEKLHIFKVHNRISFNIYLYICNHHNDQDANHTHPSPLKVCLYSFVIPAPGPSLPSTSLWSIFFYIASFAFFRTLYKCNYTYACFLSQHNYFEISFVFINGSFIVEKYIWCIYYHLFINLLMNIWVVSRFLAFTNKAAMNVCVPFFDSHLGFQWTHLEEEEQCESFHLSWVNTWNKTAGWW